MVDGRRVGPFRINHQPSTINHHSSCWKGAIEVMPEYTIVGKPVPRVDAVDKVTGAAKYAADWNLPGMLWGTFLHSPHPHARILSIDTSRAEALPGVVAVITQKSLGAGASLETEDTVHGMKVSQNLFASDV